MEFWVIYNYNDVGSQCFNSRKTQNGIIHEREDTRNFQSLHLR